MEVVVFNAVVAAALVACPVVTAGVVIVAKHVEILSYVFTTKVE